MRYRNLKTEAVIETTCIIHGEDWTPVDRGVTRNGDDEVDTSISSSDDENAAEISAEKPKTTRRRNK